MISTSPVTTVQYSNCRRIENRASGEVLEFVTTAADTRGAYTEAIVTAPAGFPALDPHAHPKQDEEFEVLAGRMGVKNNGETRILGPGEVIHSAAGSVHTWWNDGDEEVRFRVTVTPALQFAEMLGAFYHSANERNNTEPSLVDAAYILSKYRDNFDAVSLPKPILAIILPPLYALGKITGRHQVMERYIATHYE
jgi:quercetin dioxygenase-like cupin family protein